MLNEVNELSTKEKVVLAFSGGLDTSFCVPYLLDQGYEMFHLGADGEVKHSTEIVHKKFGDYIFIHRSKLEDRARGPFAAAQS